MKILNGTKQNPLGWTCVSVSVLALALLTGCIETESDAKGPPEKSETIATGTVSADENGRAGEGAVFFNNPRAIGEEPDGNIIVADFSSGHIVRINRQTGDRYVLSDNNNPDQGPVFSQAAGVAILPDGRIFVSDLVFNNVYELSLIHI